MSKAQYFEKLSTFTRKFNKKAVELLRLNREDSNLRIADIACGIGHFSIEVFGLIGSGCTIDAIDIEPSIINVLEIDLKRRDINCVHAKVMDAQDLQYEDNIFSHVAMVFGLMYIPNKEKAVR